MSVPGCTILGMQTYQKYTWVCTGDCDALIEYTFKDGFGWPNGVMELTCPCGSNCILLSAEDATIPPINQTKEETMDTTNYSHPANVDGSTVPHSYNANALVTYKDINNGVASYPTLKVNELEWKLERIKNLEIQLSISNNQIRNIIDNLSEDGWFNPNYEREEILNDLCEILDHEPKKEISFEGTIHFSGRVDVRLADLEDFDLDDMLSELTVDVYNGDVVIDEFSVEDVREN
jgi:hypothetical protein